VHFTGSGGIDWRTSPGYSRRGGAYGVTYHAYRDRGDTYNFNRVDAEVIQHLPILRETWVLSLRGRVQSTVGDTDAVPYFLMPALGGGSTLRAYSTGRFRDRHALLLQAEWRWTPSRRAVDMALFYDAGKVTDKRSGLDLDGLKSNVGIGIRFHGPMTTPLRVELARGREGLHLVITSGAAF
jgi:outer membrane protein assembly factor BamA